MVAVYRTREGQTVAGLQLSRADLVFIAVVVGGDYDKVSFSASN